MGDENRRRGAESRNRNFAAHDLPAWTPGADGYKKDGTPMYNNNDRAQEAYDRHYEGTGITPRVNPDGGVPHGEEFRQMQLEERRRMAEEREKRRRIK